MEKTLICPKCGAVMPGDRKFCTNCGAPLAAQPQDIAFPDDPDTLQFPADVSDPEVPNQDSGNVFTIPSFANNTISVPAQTAETSVSVTAETEDLGLVDKPFKYGAPELQEEEPSGIMDFIRDHLLYIIIAAVLLALIIILLVLNPFKKKEPVPEPTPEPTPTPTAEVVEPTADPNDPGEEIGKITIYVNGLNIRNAASQEADAVGTAYYGEEYPVYEITEGGSLTWYRIDLDKWIGNPGSYLEYTPNE